MDFPAKACEPSAAPAGLAEALGCELVACGLNGMDYLVEVANEAVLRGLMPNFTALASLLVRRVIVTCLSESPEFDFISIFF